MLLKRQREKPNPLRLTLYMTVIFLGLFGGYYLGGFFVAPHSSGKSLKIPQKSPSPWFRSQSHPPSMVTAPDSPLFPDTIEDQPAGPKRAYEEALPEDIYEPDMMSMPIPPPPKRASIPPPPMAPHKSTPPPPWRRFAVAAPDAGDRPRIALIIDDMGVDRMRSAQVIRLKAPLTLSFLTYANNLKAQTKAARAAGHELLLHMSMEPGSAKVDPGPNVLLTSHNKDELLRRFRWGLARFEAYVGVNNHMGSKFTEDVNGMSVVLGELKQRGLLFLDSRTSGASVAGELAKNMGLPYAVRNIFLDNINDEAAVYARLAETERLARANGYAIAIGHPRDATIKILPRWIKEIEKLGFVLTPLSSVVHGVDY